MSGGLLWSYRDLWRGSLGMAFLCYRGGMQEGGVCVTKQRCLEAWRYVRRSVTGSGCFCLVLDNILLPI